MDSTYAFIFGPDGTPLEQVNLSSQAVSYLVSDSLGSVRGVVAASGSLQASTSYDAWGNPVASGGLASYTPLGFAGGYTDPSGLIYLLSRYYDPSTGQFLSVDPAVDQTLQPYAYAADDPANESDPTGAMVKSAGGGFTCNHKRRHNVKTGRDQVLANRTPMKSYTPRPRSVGKFLHHHDPFRGKRPAMIEQLEGHPNKRFGPLERHVYKIKGYVWCGKKDCRLGGNFSDGDLTFELSPHAKREPNRSIHCEIPNVDCTGGSQWQGHISTAWRTMSSLLQGAHCGPGSNCTHRLHLRVEGVGFWDTLAYPRDRSPELHPLRGRVTRVGG